MSRSALIPSSALPLVYFGVAHAAFGLACVALVLDPSIPGGYFLHPRMAAIVHLLTVGWISGSILGAFYIVAPLALGMPLPVRAADWGACAAYAAGLAGMVGHFWIGEYQVMALSGLLVLSAVAWLGIRAAKGVRSSTAPPPVLLHVMLAFVNMVLAGALGAAIGLDRATGLLGLPPLAAAYAHLHLAVIGWPVVLVVGLAYRLVPMFLPARMPEGRGLASSAILLEAGLTAIVVSLLLDDGWLPAGGLLVAAGVAVFARNMRAAVRQRLPRPPALPVRDWSTWQTHAAIAWLLVSVVLGIVVAFGAAGESRVAVAWVYGAAGLVGFVSQIVVGIQGRLVPLYAWYRTMAAQAGASPRRGANELPTARYARPIFLLWSIAVPWLVWGLAVGDRWSIRGASLVLLCAVGLGAFYLAYLMRAAR